MRLLTSILRRPFLKSAYVAATLTLALATTASAQTYLIDTGAGGTSSIGAPSLFASGSTTCSPQPGCAQDFQFIGAQFTLTEAASITSIEAWMGPFGTGGSLDVKIRENVNGLPGLNFPPLFSPNSIYSKRYTVANRFVAGWVPFAGYAAVLPAGTYWVTFEPVAGSQMNYSMPIGAPSPCAKYAFWAFGNANFAALGANATLGIRIAGTAFPGLAFGTATRTTMKGSFFGNSFDYDFIRTGTRDFAPVGVPGDALTSSYIFVIPAGYVHGRGKLTESGLTAGAYSIHSTCLVPSCDFGSSGFGRGVAYRTYQNLSDVAKTFTVNNVLHGSFGNSGFFGNSVAAAGVYALDTQAFSNVINNSGLSAAEFLLRDRASLDLATVFPGAVLDRVFVTPSPAASVSIPISLAPITVAPGATFTLLYDVYAYASNASLDFSSTLSPAAVPFTDGGGNPVIELVPVGAAQPASPQATAIAMTPAAGTSNPNTVCTLTATVTGAGGAPVADVPVVFTNFSGPNAGLTATVSSGNDGKAAFTYVSNTAGTDSVRAEIGALKSNAVSRTWLAVAGAPAPPTTALTLGLEMIENPARGGALRLRYTLPAAHAATIELYDLSGRRVASRRLDDATPGTHSIAVQAERPLAPGVYLVRLTQAEGRTEVRAIVLR